MECAAVRVRVLVVVVVLVLCVVVLAVSVSVRWEVDNAGDCACNRSGVRGGPHRERRPPSRASRLGMSDATGWE